MWVFCILESFVQIGGKGLRPVSEAVSSLVDLNLPASAEDSASSDVSLISSLTQKLSRKNSPSEVSSPSGFQKKTGLRVDAGEDDLKWVLARIPMAFKVETEVFNNLALSRLGIYDLNSGQEDFLESHAPIFINTRTDLIRCGAINNFRAKFKIKEGQEAPFNFKKVYTLTFPVAANFTPKLVAEFITPIEIVFGSNLTYVYTPGSCKMVGGRKYSGTY